MNKFSTLLTLIGITSPLFAKLPEPPTKRPEIQTKDQTFLTEEKKTDTTHYQFDIAYRAELGYLQNQLRSDNITYANPYLHGVRTGATMDFLLPHRFSIQIGLLYSFSTAKNTQYCAPMSAEDIVKPDAETGKVPNATLEHQLFLHELTIPVRAHINIKLYKKLNLFFYTGPQLQLGLAFTDHINANISASTKTWMDQVGQPYQTYDRYKNKELKRTNIQYGLGGGLEWDKYRLQAGYDFGLNNLVKSPRIEKQKMNEWGWFVSFCYLLHE